MNKIRTSYQKGKSYEKRAGEYLKSIGYIILEKNYKNKIGEIDIIVFKDNTISFIEVKGQGLEKFHTEGNINSFKKKKIIKTGINYINELKNNKQKKEEIAKKIGFFDLDLLNYSFDVIIITGKSLCHYDQAYEISGNYNI